MSMTDVDAVWERRFDFIDDDDPRTHSEECTCETCLQNHPEREHLLDDDIESRDEEPFCYTCVSSADRVLCETCGGDGFIEHEPDNEEPWTGLEDCPDCDGKGGWWVCLGTARHNLEPGSIHAIPIEQRVAEAWSKIAAQITQIFHDMRPVVQALWRQLSALMPPETRRNVECVRRRAALRRARAIEQVPPNVKHQQARAAQIERIRSGARWQKTTGERERRIAAAQKRRKGAQ
jgi:hypothetical protein